MKLEITNKSKRPVFRFGKRFDPEQTVTMEDVTPRQHLALRAVRALDVREVPDKPAEAGKEAKKGAKESRAKSTAEEPSAAGTEPDKAAKK